MSKLASVLCAVLAVSGASLAAAAPPRAPNTRPSWREFAASRFAPWTPEHVTSPAA